MGERRRRLLRSALAAVLALSVGVAAVLVLALQGAPQVERAPDVSVADVTRAVRLLRSIDPRRPHAGGWREATLGARDVELLLDQAGQRARLAAATRIRLTPGRLHLQGSVALSGVFARWWLNVDATLAETAELPAIERLRIGDLQVPAGLAGRALPWLLARAAGSDELRLAREVVQGMAFETDQLVVRYVWHAGTTGRLLAALVPQADQDRLRAYFERLATLEPKSLAGGRIALVQLLRPLFELARERSAAGGDATQENRAAILALAFAPFPRQLVAVVPAARRWRLPPRWQLALHGRIDFPLHFAVSAALAVEAGGPLADAIGVFKETLDAGDGSGFSFNDIAADRAGRRFGQLALRAPVRLQQAMAAGVADADLMPDVSDLPEFLRPAQFAERYGAVGSPAYQRQLRQIDDRLDALPLYR